MAGSPAAAHILLFLSGAAALMYESVWARRLALIFGGTVRSVGVVLAAMMAGLALGAWLGGRWSARSRRPLALYGIFECGAALTALLLPAAFASLQAAFESRGAPSIHARFLVSFLALLPTCLCLGASFPAMAQHHCPGQGRRAGEGPSRSLAPGAGGLYAANLAGAAFGTGLGSFVLLPVLGLKGAYLLAAALSASCGAAALLLARGAGERRPEGLRTRSFPVPASAAAALFASGFCGMAYEVVWTRLLVPTFNNSAYGFASVLLVFLAGSGLGSFLADRALPEDASAAARRSLPGMLLTLGALAAALAYGVFEVSQLLQIRFADYGVSGVSPHVAIPLLEAICVLLPLAVIQGAFLPCALRAAASGGSSPLQEDPGGAEARPGEAVGLLFFWNTLGAIAGSTAAAFWWIPAWNVQRALLASILTATACGGVLGALPAGGPRRWASPALALAALAAAWRLIGGEHLPLKLLADWGARTPQKERRVLWYAEDLEASVAVDERGGTRMLLINGVGVAGYGDATKLLAHIPLLLHPAPERTLVICFGMGATFRSALSHGARVDAVDLVPSVFSAFPFFFPDAAARAADPRGRLLVNDGRNHLLAEKEGYDVILVDPSPPLYAAGTVNLYNRDFFDLARRRLKPGGLLAVWLPDYPASEFLMVVRSFAEALPHARLWRLREGARGLVLLGGDSPLPLDEERVRRRMNRPAVAADLEESGGAYSSPEAFWKLDLGPAVLWEKAWAGLPSVTDDFPWIEYPFFRSLRASYYRSPDLLDAPAREPSRRKKGGPSTKPASPRS